MPRQCLTRVVGALRVLMKKVAPYPVALLGGGKALPELQEGHLLQQVVPTTLTRVKLLVPPWYLLKRPELM